MKLFTASWPGQEMNRQTGKRHFTEPTLQAGLINQVDNDYLITVLTQTLPLASSPNFWVNS